MNFQVHQVNQTTNPINGKVKTQYRISAPTGCKLHLPTGSEAVAIVDWFEFAQVGESPASGDETVYISTSKSPEEVTYQVLAVVYQELKPIETLLAQNKTAEAHQQLMQFMSEIKEKQTELIEQITPF